jgi:Holliday junction resolvase RusA-like endonuclease
MTREIVVVGIPLSLQAKNSKHKEAWKQTVAAAARDAVREDEKYLEGTPVGLVVIQFSFGWEEGDLDNIAKPILDGLSGPVFSDDRQVEQLTLRRTELGKDIVDIVDPTPRLADALQGAYAEKQDFIYIRVDDGPNHRNLP